MTQDEIDIIKIKYLIERLKDILYDIRIGVCYGNEEYIENIIYAEEQKLKRLK